ncbi:hypothetical protein D9M72_483550 [compost metagenome]
MASGGLDLDAFGMTLISLAVRLKSRAHFSLKRNVSGKSGAVVGITLGRRTQARQRLGIIIAGFALIFLVIMGRLVQYGLERPVETAWINDTSHAVASRPDIVDRHGELLATDVNMVSLYAEPRKIVDADEVVEKLATVIPNLDWRDTHRKLRSGTAFQWLRRQLTPRQRRTY